MSGELSWNHAVLDIAEGGLSTVRHASAEELDKVARALELIVCSSLTASYMITPTGGGHFRLSGRLQASVQQACVVTLEPVLEDIDEPFDVAFWPEADIPPPAGGEIDLDEEPEIEPTVAGQIEVGRIVFECLAGAIDPFPRKAGAALERVAAGPAGGRDGKPESPFSVLAKIREKG
jgi:Large ribosomal RNA subunit accumulation protein YceD